MQGNWWKETITLTCLINEHMGIGSEGCSLRVNLCKPPSRTCKKEQAGIRLQAYLWKPRSKQKQTNDEKDKKLTCLSPCFF